MATNQSGEFLGQIRPDTKALVIHQRQQSLFTKSRNRTPLQFSENHLQRVTEEPASVGTSRHGGTVTNTVNGRSKKNSNRNSNTDKADFDQIGQELLPQIVSVIMDETDETNQIGVIQRSKSGELELSNIRPLLLETRGNEITITGDKSIIETVDFRKQLQELKINIGS